MKVTKVGIKFTPNFLKNRWKVRLFRFQFLDIIIHPFHSKSTWKLHVFQLVFINIFHLNLLVVNLVVELLRPAPVPFVYPTFLAPTRLYWHLAQRVVMSFIVAVWPAGCAQHRRVPYVVVL